MVYIIGLTLLVVLAAILYFAGVASLKRARARSDQMKALADSLGLSLLDPLPEDATLMKQRRPPHGVDIRSAYPALPLLNFSSSRTYHVIEGDHRGRKVRLFELTYVVSTGKHAHTVFYGVASADVGKPMPRLDVRYEGLWHKVKELFGKSDVHLDNPEFDKRYLIAADDELFARSVLDYELQEQMLQTPFDGHLLTGTHAVVYSHGAPSPEQFQALLERAHRLADSAAPYAR